MANNLIQIKRSSSNAVVTGLQPGELAFTQVSNTLWIGLPDGSNTISIAGVRNPGLLTANQALVANATSEIDQIKVANAVIGTVWANGSAGSNGQTLISNGSTVYWGTGTSGSNTQIQFNDSGVANATSGFTFNKDSNTVFVSNLITTNTANAVSFTVGTNLVANDSGLFVANTSGTVNAANITVGTDLVANASGLFVANTSGTVNAATISVGTLFTANSSLVNAAAINITNQVNTASLYASSNVNIANQVSITDAGVFVSNSTGTVNAATISVGTDFIANSTKVTFSGANIDATSAFLKVADAIVTGNLTVEGTVTSIETTQLTVNDNIFQLGSDNTETDIIDSGFFTPAGNGASVWYSGFVRVADKSTDTNPYFKIFGTGTNPNTSSTIDTGAATGSLEAYLLPYGVGGAFVANSSNVFISANSSFGVDFEANTLTLTTPLAGTSGGTGLNSYEDQDLLVANTSNGFSVLAFNANTGYVLQSNGSALIYASLDGGAF